MANKRPHRGVPKGTAGPPKYPTLLPFGERVESVRLEKGLTQQGVTAAAQISMYYYGMITKGRGNPSLTVVLRLADALGVPAADLLPYSNKGRFVPDSDLEDVMAGFTWLAAAVEQIAGCKQD